VTAFFLNGEAHHGVDTRDKRGHDAVGWLRLHATGGICREHFQAKWMPVRVKKMLSFL
jgi:hypothetical protein